MTILKRHRLRTWEADLLLVQVAAGWEVHIACQGKTHAKPYATLAAAEHEYARCLASEDQLRRDLARSAA